MAEIPFRGWFHSRPSEISATSSDISTPPSSNMSEQPAPGPEPSVDDMPEEAADSPSHQVLTRLEENLEYVSQDLQYVSQKLEELSLDVQRVKKMQSDFLGSEPCTAKMLEKTTDVLTHKLRTEFEKLAVKMGAIAKNDTKEANNSPAPNPQPPTAEADDEIQEYWDHSVPWPGNSYVIIEKSTRRSISDHGDVWLEEGEYEGEAPAPSGHNTWLCVDKANSLMFFNKSTCRYLGSLSARWEPAPLEAAQSLKGGAFRFVTRAHPQGGHEIFLHNGDKLRTVAVAEDNSHLHARWHGPTLWEFHKVPE